MKGYWNRPDATAEVLNDGWLLTGDLARTDQDGYFFIVDRKKEMIIRGGFNVYPREIEEVLYEHPAVLEAAVIGIPDEALGEEIAAAIVLRPDHDASADEIRAVRQRPTRGLQIPPPRLVHATSYPKDQPARSSNAKSPHPTPPPDGPALAAAAARGTNLRAGTSPSRGRAHA